MFPRRPLPVVWTRITKSILVRSRSPALLDGELAMDGLRPGLCPGVLGGVGSIVEQSELSDSAGEGQL